MSLSQMQVDTINLYIEQSNAGVPGSLPAGQQDHASRVSP
ncbi:hypothetical protein PCA31118_04911 [Pandoraea captiosa]|uniref:Uncharacterized protein n=1 Tax=Pandoraea captiosa TaxID=2508302 RepID=A0A5E5ARD3_9BURK|nr:hypothetical protein PCA31118_04911 [Pandoraea captiosa]